MDCMIYEKKEQKKPQRMERKPAMHEFDKMFDCPLRQADIVLAIQYYGIAELLDHIGVTEIKRYLANR